MRTTHRFKASDLDKNWNILRINLVLGVVLWPLFMTAVNLEPPMNAAGKNEVAGHSYEEQQRQADAAGVELAERSGGLP